MNKCLQMLTLGFLFAFGATSIASAADQPDPAIGTWVLNLDKSKFHGGAAPKSMTRTYSAGSAGTDMKVTGVAADGSAISQTVTLTYDGKDCVIAGTPGLWDTLSLTKVNGSTVKSVLKKDGKTVGHSTRSISGKGKVLTLTSSLKTAKGGTTHDVAVYDKQ
jgi:hypothetical protein